MFPFSTNNILTYSNQDGALSLHFLLLGCGLKFVNALGLLYIFDSFSVNVVYDGLQWLNEVVVGPDMLGVLRNLCCLMR